MTDVRIEYDRQACDAWFQCVQHWDAFEMNVGVGKADLDGAEEDAEGLLVREVPPDEVDAAKEAAASCPVDAIAVYEDDELVVPE